MKSYTFYWVLIICLFISINLSAQSGSRLEGTIIIRVAQEGTGIITNNSGENSVKGAMYWNATKWVTNETAAHLFFEYTATGERAKIPEKIEMSGNTDSTSTVSGYQIERKRYTYSYPATSGGKYQYQAMEYRIVDPEGRKVVLRSRGTGNGTANGYFDIYVEVIPNQVTAIRNDPKWFEYPAGITMSEVLEQNNSTQYLYGDFPSTDGFYFMDINGGGDLGGISYIFHTGAMTGTPNTSTLGASFPVDFWLRFTDMNDNGRLIEFQFLPLLVKETYIPDGPTSIVISNERGLIDELQKAGYGDSCLYSVLMAMKPLSKGLISDALAQELAACPASSELFMLKLSNFSNVANNPICINTDGTLHVISLFGRDYYGKEGYPAYSFAQNGAGRVCLVYASNTGYYIDAGSSNSGGNPYKAFMIVW
jgi:hypothetical protein